MINYLILIFAVACASSVQLIIKGQLNDVHGQFPTGASDLFFYLLKILKDPYMWLAGFMLVFAAFLWYFVVSRISLGVAFSFAALSYPFVMIGSMIFLGEQFQWQHFLGCAMIVGGLVFIASASA